MLVGGTILAGAGPARAAPATPPSLAFSPSPYNYGSVTGGQTAAETFTLANSGGSASSSLSLALAGSGTFSITADTCAGTSLGPEKSCTVTVQFASTSAGNYTATLTAATKKATATDSLSGTGISAGRLYWANEGYTGRDGSINEANLDGSNPQTIAILQNLSAGVAVDSTHLYWANGGDGSINEANLDGSNPQTIVTGQNSPDGVAVDSSHLYWANQTDGTINEANLDGSNPHILPVGNQGRPSGVAVSG